MKKLVFFLFLTPAYRLPFMPSKSRILFFILMDNLGYGEPGCYGGGEIRGAATPRIDN
jgi:hypothetical protein